MKKMKKLIDNKHGMDLKTGIEYPNDLLDVLLDEDNKDPIVTIDQNENKVTFEQVAVVPYNNKIYCLLKPLSGIPYVKSDEVYVFYVDINDKGPALLIEQDLKIAEAIYEVYLDLFKRALSNE